jgi:membrane dipeptidase
MDIALSTRARDLITRSIVWDNHGCMPLTPPDPVHLRELERYASTGWSMVSINVGYAEHTLEDHVLALANFRRWIAARPDKHLLVRTAQDVETARRTGRLGVAFDVEGMGPLNGGRIDLVQLFYDLGVRWMLVAYNKATDAGSGCFDEPDGGLTPYGHQVLAEMERVGMVICCSHTGPKTALEVCAAATKPVVLSHSNPRALWDHPRNVSDELMKAVAATGGVVGINGIGPFLAANDASTETFVRHLDHAVQTIGPDHVGLGIDYAFGPTDEEMIAYLKAHPYVFPHWDGKPIQMMEPERLPHIVEHLLALGYADGDVSAILGGNWLRVAKDCWK